VINGPTVSLLVTNLQYLSDLGTGELDWSVGCGTTENSVLYS